jgi:hypothetical protein
MKLLSSFFDDWLPFSVTFQKYTQRENWQLAWRLGQKLRNRASTFKYFCLDGQMIAPAAGDNVLMEIEKNTFIKVTVFDDIARVLNDSLNEYKVVKTFTDRGNAL